jgi:hypothetical protein
LRALELIRGPYGGYRVGRGLRLPPLMFSAAEATGLVVATLEGHRGAADPADVVGGALAKILRALPERVAPSVRPAAGEWVRHWVSPSLARLEEAPGDRTRMVASTEDPDWYARQLAAIPVDFRVVDSPDLLAAVRALGQRLAGSAEQ